VTGPDVVVGIDQGGHATRAAAYDATGRALAIAEVPVHTRRDEAGHVEHDGEALLAGLQEALTRLAATVDAGRWRAAGLAVQRSSIACWDRRDGTALSPVISWQDRRQAGWLSRFEPHATEVHALTGLPLSPHYGASKLRWCLDHLPAVREAADGGRLCAGPLASFLLARLLDEAPCIADEANASRTQLWSPQERAWAAPLLQMFGLPAQVLPRLVPTRGHFGTMRVGAARVPLRACTGDQSAVPFACGPLDADTTYVNLGTGAFALRPLRQPLRAAPLLTSVLDSDAEGVTFALEGTVNGAGAAVDWFAGRAGLDAHEMVEALDADPPDGDVPLFLNGVSGVGSPFWHPTLPSRFVGNGSPMECLRGVLESIAFLLRANLDAMAVHAGRPARLLATGGLSRSGTLVTALASLAGAPLECLDDAEATARGVAFLAAGRPAGWCFPPRERLAPCRDAALEARYARWLGLMQEAVRR